MTKKLYLNESYLKEFEANIISCTPLNGSFALVLDETAFYPEGGGQPCDKGYIDEVEVIDVVAQDDQILHITEKEISPKRVKCRLDWNRRYDFMQQHTGQHILSHCFLELFNGKTDSFHLGAKSVSIEIDILDFDQNRCSLLENMANEIIYKNLPIEAITVDEEALKKLPLRKKPSVNDNIRIVRISDMDYSPCGGTHVMNTGEVGMIKIIKLEKLKESYRFEFLCGERALHDYRDKNILVNSLCAKFSVKDYELDKAVERLINEYKNLNKEYAGIKKTLLKYEAGELYEQSEMINNKKIVHRLFENRKADEIKVLAGEIASRSRSVALLGVLNDTAQVFFYRSDDVDMDMNSLLKSVLPIINGKGGGSSKSAQGGGGLTQSLNDLMEEAYKRASEI